MSTSSKTSYKGVRKVGTCNGYWKCQNPNCGFFNTSVDNQPNRIDWLTVKGKKKDVKINILQKDKDVEPVSLLTTTQKQKLQ